MPDPHADIRSPDKMVLRHAAVMLQQNAAARSNSRMQGAQRAAMLLLGAGLAWSVYNNNRLATIAFLRETVYAVLQPNGEFVASSHYKDVTTAGKQENDIQSALWTYVQARDCYSKADFIRDAYIDEAMSDTLVTRQVTNQLSLDNPRAPQHVYGDKNITVHCEEVDPATPIGEGNNEYYFRFRRWEDDGHPVDIAAAPIYSVAVRYRTGIYPTDDPKRAWLEKTTFNPPGVQVIDYPGAKPENSMQPPRRATGGGS